MNMFSFSFTLLTYDIFCFKNVFFIFPFTLSYFIYYIMMIRMWIILFELINDVVEHHGMKH